MPTSTIANPKTVSRAEWLVVRKKLLAREKRHTHERDAIAAERRSLPWVDKAYVFDAPGGKKTLADLFDGKSQLIVYHFMFAPDWEEGCPSCSFVMDLNHDYGVSYTKDELARDDIYIFGTSGSVKTRRAPRCRAARAHPAAQRPRP